MSVSVTDPLVVQAASNTGLPPSVVAAQINVESGGDPNAVSPAGAEGEFQFLPSTYTGLGFPAGTEFNPAEEVHAYEKYMTELLQWAKGDVRKALAAYNAGQGGWQAGLGYADTILGNARQGQGLTVGTHQQPQTGASGAWQDLFGVLQRAADQALAGIFPGGSTALSRGEASLITGSSDPIGGVAVALAGIERAIAAIAQPIDWLLHPNHWIRIFAGLFGGALVVAGIWQMSHAGGA